METLYEIQLDNGSRLRAIGDDEALNLKTDDYCVFRKEFYTDCGRVTRVIGPAKPEDHFQNASIPEKKTETPTIQRKATVVDQGKEHENIARAKSSLRTAAFHVDQLKLPMKLINAHYSFDGRLITIQFSSEGRVDFRELVKQLSAALNTRIELRQIGVRDETAAVGGLAPCGRVLCCRAFLTEFASINVKMAKEQDLSLTPSTISGVCGRLKCCLKYEHAGYLEMEKSMPRRGDCCECAEGRGRIIDRNLLTQKVVVSLDESGRNVTFPKEEVTVVYPEKRRPEGGRPQEDFRKKRNDASENSVRPHRPQAGAARNTRFAKTENGAPDGNASVANAVPKQPHAPDAGEQSAAPEPDKPESHVK